LANAVLIIARAPAARHPFSISRRSASTNSTPLCHFEAIRPPERHKNGFDTDCLHHAHQPHSCCPGRLGPGRIAIMTGAIQPEKPGSAETAALVTGGFGYGLASITALLSANGGALITLLSLIGNVWNKSTSSAIALATELRFSILLLGLGVALAAATPMAAYFSQILFLDLRSRPGRFMQVFACLCAVLSLAAFGAGTYWAATAIAFVQQGSPRALL
jgi:hypothetical protein